MPRPTIKFPYCRWCLKTRDNPDEWRTKTTTGEIRKYAACGTCGRILAWNIRKTQHKIRRTSVPDNVEKNKTTSNDVQDNLDFWKQFKHKFQRKP